MEVCRMCGGTEVLKCFLGNKQLIELLRVCANIEVKEDDYLPKNICEQCEFGLRFSYRLRKQSEETEKRLRQEVMQTQAISTTTHDVQDVTILCHGAKQVQPIVTPIGHTKTTVTNTQQSLPVEVVDETPSNINDTACKLLANEQTAAEERQVSTSTIDTSDEQKNPQPAERFRLLLKQRGVVMSTVKVDVLTESPPSTQTVIAEKRIQLDIDDETANDYTTYAEEFHLNEHNVEDDDVIEVIDDDSMTQELLPEPVMEVPIKPDEAILQQEQQQSASVHELVPDESHWNANDCTPQDIIEEILSSDEDNEQLENSTTEDTTLNNVVYEDFDEEYDEEYEESIGINDCQMYITKEEREDIIPYDDEETLDAEETGSYLENETIYNKTEGKIFNFNSSTTESTITEKISNYICPTCNAEMKNQREYRQHIKIHGKERFRCPECHKWFAQRYLLTVHAKTHNKDEERHRCPHCPLSYQKRCNLTRHINNKHENKMYICNVCGENFGRSDILKRHMVTHSDQRDFQCHKCPDQFKTKQGMDRHLLTHAKSDNANDDALQSKNDNNDPAEDSNASNDKTYSAKSSHSCHYCGKVSKHHHTHRMHMRIHTQERPHQCDSCGKSFRTLAALITHERIHDEARPYQCEHCLLSFRQLGHLNEHRMIHEGIQPHACSICKLSFTKKYNMLVHMRIHSGENPYKCVTCGEQFRRSRQLRKHEQKEHNKIFVADNKKTEEDKLVQEARSRERAFDIEEIVAEEEAEIVGDLEPVNNANESTTSFANLATRLLRNDSDDLEIIENVSPPPPTAEQIACNEMELEKVIGAGLIQSFSNVLPEEFHIDNNDVVLVVDDNDNFSSLFIMDD